MKRDAVAVSAIWGVLTIIGLVLASAFDILPHSLSEQGDEIASTFKLLTILSVPVITMVIAVLGYSMVRFASFDMPDDDGMPIEGRGAVPMAWFGITSALAVVTMVIGIVALPKVLAVEHSPDLRVAVTGVQWTWLVSYPDQNVRASREMVLPVDRVITFDVTSQDVIHSFWIPGFSMKVDSVPGITTHVSIKPTETGTYATNPMLRVQCSQLCGLAHGDMWMPVRVVSDADFEQWIAQQTVAQPTPAGTPGAPAQEITITAKNIVFDTDTLTAKAGQPVHLTFDNQDGGIPHNWALYKDEDAAKSGEQPLAATLVENGPVKQELRFNAPDAGTYYFRCDVHPATMTGTFVVE